MAQTIKLKRSGTSGNIPTTSQLELGEVAINTYDGKMFIKKNVGGTESIVEISAAAADAILVEYQFTSTASQTTYSGSDDNSETLSYTPNAIQVFMNGILLDPGIDFTATNGYSIVLAEAADANDYLQIFAFKKKISDGQVSVDTFTGDDSTVAFTLSVDPGDENNTRVFIDGVYQSKANYSVSGTTLTFSTAPPTGTAVEVEIGNRIVTLDTLSDLDLPDSVRLRLGTGQDLQIYHDGNTSWIQDSSADLRVESNGLTIRSSTQENYIEAAVNGAVTVYYDGSAKLATTNDGISVTGDVEATGEIIGDLRGATLFKAQAGESLAKGEVVYISGISGNTTVVSKADADDANKMPAFGIVAAAASSGNPVDIYTAGIIADIDTSAYSEGDELFVSTTAGALTATAPTGESAALQKIGKVTRSDATGGRIFIIGAGRTNAVPNLNEGRLFVGNSSNQAVADNTVHVDIANSRVGIGTTSTVSGAQLTLGGGSRIAPVSGNGLNLAAGGSDRMFISTGGNVGIGTSSPSSPLEVAGGSVYPTTKFSRDGGTAGTQGYLTTGFSAIGYSGGTGADTYMVSEHGFGFAVNAGTNALVITDGGNVGIGTGSPSVPLHVDGSVRFDLSSGENLYLYRSTASNLSLSLGSANTDFESAGTINFKPEGTTVQKYQFKSADFIVNGPNVGIGTASPQVALHIYDTPAELLRMEGNDEYAYASFYGTVSSTAQRLGYMGFANDTSTAADFNFANNQGGLFSFNAGIETVGTVHNNSTQVGFKHTAHGIATGNTNKHSFQIGRWIGSYNRWMMVPETEGTPTYQKEFGFDFEQNGWFVEGTFTTDVVGVGTSSPRGELEIESSGVTNLYLTRNDATINDTNSLGVISFSGTEDGSTYIDGAQVYAKAEVSWSSGDNKTGLAFATNSGNSLIERMRIKHDGKVAIGGASAFSGTPENTLSLIHDGHGLGFDYVGATLPRTAGLFTSSSALTQTAYGDLNIKARSDYGNYYGIGFFTAGADNSPVNRMAIKANGNVVINESEFSSLPTGSKLNIFGNGITLRLDGSSGTTKSILFRGTNVANPGEVYADGSLRFRTEDANTRITFHTNSSGSDSERMRIESTGEIRIDGGNSQRPIIKPTNWGYSSGYRVALLGSASTSYNTAGTGSITLSMGYDPSSNTNGSFTGDGREILFRRGAQFVTPNSSDDSFYLHNLVLKDGNVGIGQASPSEKLHIGNGESNYIRIHNAASGDVASGITITRGNSNGASLYDNPADNATTLLAAGSLNFRVNNANRAMIDTSGRVIIHDDVTYTANAPTHRGSLILAGASGFTNYGGLEFHTSSGGGAGYGTRIVSSDAILLFGRRFNATAWSESMRIDNNGNLCIGVGTAGAAGGATVNVSGSTTDLTLYGATTSYGGRIFFGDSSDRCSIQGIYDSGGGGRLTFHTDTTGGTNFERMRIDNNGRLILRDYVTNYNIQGSQFYEKRGGRRNGTGTYTLFTNGVSNTQSGGYVRVTAIYGTPSGVGVWLYKIGGNRSITLVWSSTSGYSGSTPSVTWNSSSLQVANSDTSTYYTVEVELFNIGIGWSATWGNFPGFVS